MRLNLLEEKTRGIKQVACFINPFLTLDNVSTQLISIKESIILDILHNQKIALRFERKLEKDPIFQEKFFSAFPNIKNFFRDLDVKVQKDSEAFELIKNVFSRNGIEFILIKSDGSFPYESDNIDVLIKPKNLRKVAKLLNGVGYYELVNIREPHKFLFRNKTYFEVLPLHIHTQVEWEGTRFVSSQDLWNRCRLASDNHGFLVPSPEECILITIAHLFFENHEIKLGDIFKVTEKIKNCDIDWDYMLDRSSKLYWGSAFSLTLLLMDLVYKELYKRPLLPKEILLQLRRSAGYLIMGQKAINVSGSDVTPLKIPYSFAALFFLNRVLRESRLPAKARMKHVGWIASDISKRKMHGFMENHFSSVK